MASSTAWGNTAAARTANGNMYAGHDGNVYKNTGSGWQSYDNGNWNSVNKPSPQFSQATEPRSSSAERAGAGSSSETQGLENEVQNRQRGDSGASGFDPRGVMAAVVAYSTAVIAVAAVAYLAGADSVMTDSAAAGSGAAGAAVDSAAVDGAVEAVVDLEDAVKRQSLEGPRSDQMKPPCRTHDNRSRTLRRPA